MQIYLQIDPPAGFKPQTDSTIALALEAQVRGHELFYYTLKDLFAENGTILANARPITFFDRETEFFTEGPVERIALEETADVILIRQDPPYDMAYLTTTWLLEKLKRPRILNAPRALRENPEKLFPLAFAEFCPPTLISADETELRRFQREQGAVVVKPLYGHGGHGVFSVPADGSNLGALLELYLARSPEPLVMQRYLPEVAAQEKRILLINGETAGAFGRVPVSGEIRSNMRVGGKVVETGLTPRQQKICAAIGPVCQREGVLLAGLDVIGDHLIEVNITSPTGIRTLWQLTGENPARKFWDALS